MSVTLNLSDEEAKQLYDEIEAKLDLEGTYDGDHLPQVVEKLESQLWGGSR